MPNEKDRVPTLETRHETFPPNAAPQLLALLEFWRRHQSASGAPSRAIFEPMALRPWLGHLSIYESLDCGRDFLVRLEGTAIVELTGEDWTGRMASDVDARFGSTILRAMREVIESGSPSIHCMKVYQNGFKDITRLLLPLRARPQGPIDQVLLAIYFDPTPR